MPRRPAASAGTSVWNRPRAGTRQQPAFTLGQITGAAVALADAEGLEAVTMRKLAARLGVQATSLYWYFSTKNELHELMADAVIGGIELPGPGRGQWRDELSAIAWATLAQLRRHPWATSLIFQPVPGPSTTAYGAATLRVFASAAVDPVAALNYLAAVNNYVTGFAQRDAALSASPVRGDPGGRPDGPVPAEQLAARMRLSADESFGVGLECLLDGIQLRVEPR